MKKALSLLLSLCLLVGTLPVFASAADLCGENAVWTIEDNGALTISGNGPMQNFRNESEPPWNHLYKSIKSFVVEDGITHIGNYSLSGFQNVSSVKIADSVTSIGDYAFYYSKNINNVKIPDSVTSIGMYAFELCTGLTDINIPKSVTDIGRGAFSRTGLTSVTIPDSVISIGNNAFSACPITSITVPGTVKNLGGAVFSGSDLKKAIICEGITCITNVMFSHCESLSDVDIPYSVTSIGERAFFRCYSLTSIDIPENVSVLKTGAFENCTGLEAITLPNVVYIEASAFRGCTNLSKVTLSKNITRIGGAAFDGCSLLTDVYFDGTKSQWEQIDIGTQNDALISATIHFSETSKPPQPSEPTVGNFSDVKASAYYADAVKWAVENGITSGIGGGKFAPSQTCKREQIVTFLYRSKGSPAVSVTDEFTDMPRNEEFQRAISWAVKNNITVGDGKGKFNPEKGCTRAEAMTFIWRAAGKPEPQSTVAFSDMPANQEFCTAISWAVENKIAVGTGNNKFSPNETCKREHIVTFLYNAKDI